MTYQTYRGESEEQMSDIVYVIKKQIGVIETYPTGWRKELNLISWNDSTPKYDLRDWAPDHHHMSRGVTLTPDEAKCLYEILKKEFEG